MPRGFKEMHADKAANPEKCRIERIDGAKWENMG